MHSIRNALQIGTRLSLLNASHTSFRPSHRFLSSTAGTSLPSELRFTRTHEWARYDNVTGITVGISNYAQAALGDVVYIELPEVGSEVKKGEACGSIESVKAAEDIYSPIDGKISDVVYIELPEVGSEVKKGEACGSIESVKAAEDIYSPIDGKISEINDTAEGDTQLVNSSPEDEGWLFRITTDDEKQRSSQFSELMSEDEYKTFSESDATN